MAAPPGQGRGPTDPPCSSFCSSAEPIEVPVAFFSRDLRTARLLGDHEQQQLFQPRLVAGNHQVEAGIECGLEGMGRLYDYRISRTRADPR